MKKYITVFFLFNFLVSTTSFSNEVSIQDRINTVDYYKKIYNILFGVESASLKTSFREEVDKLNNQSQRNTISFISQVDSFIPEKVLMPLVYWKFLAKTKDIEEFNSKYVTSYSRTQLIKEVITFHMLYKLLVVRDIADDPLNGESDVKAALTYLEDLTQVDGINTLNLFGKMKGKLDTIAQGIAGDLNPVNLRAQRLISEDYSIELGAKSGHNISDYVLSYTGVIPGNKVAVISDNLRDPERIDWLNKHAIFSENTVFQDGKLDIDSPIFRMPTKENPLDADWQNLSSWQNWESDGLKPNANIVFSDKDKVFLKIRDMIHEAESSIFIDIFLFGGTMGMTIAKYLIEEAKSKIDAGKDFRFLMLHDYATNYNMKNEMMPIFHYLKDSIEEMNKNPKYRNRGVLLQANIQRHPPGIPFGITNLIPKNDETFAEVEKMNTYFESKIDHSKVLVIDANTKNPKAYFGSKNWSDHSGAYYYDDAIYVEGPAAALVQSTYYDDVKAALTLDKKEQSWFYFKEQGFDNKAYLERRSEILEWIKINPSNTYPNKDEGHQVRLAQAGVEGNIKTVRNIIIDMISKAKSHIYMEQLFMYDPYINDALMKRKLQLPTLDVRILADSNSNFGFNGFPNTIYIKELKSYGINIKFRKLLHKDAEYTMADGEVYTQKYHQENHRKIISVDSKVLLGGSSNLNPDTLQGSFREFGASIYAPEVIAGFEKNFLVDWEDTDKWKKTNIENFELMIKEKSLAPTISALINSFASQLFRSKDKLEKRHR
jgi:phosphatidylserine/phosphatidylglycerophosphate/cardiolipin synthase-like enzyme